MTTEYHHSGIGRSDFNKLAIILVAALCTSCSEQNQQNEVMGLTEESLRETFSSLNATQTAQKKTTPVIKNSATPANSTETPQKVTPADTKPSNDYSSENWKNLQTAGEGDIITLKNPGLKYILRFPSDLYLAIIETPTDNGAVQRVYMENPDCQFDKLSQEGLLSEPMSVNLDKVDFNIPVWKVEGQLESLTAKVVSPFSIGVPIWLESVSFRFQSQDVSCPKKDSVFDPISKINADIIRPLAEKVYEFLKD